MSQWFEVSQGVRKGCVLSPMPFNKFLDRVIRQAMVSWSGGLHMLNTCAQTLTAVKEEGLQQNMESLDT